MSQHGSTFPISNQTFWKLLEVSAHTVSGSSDFITACSGFLPAFLVQAWGGGAPLMLEVGDLERLCLGTGFLESLENSVQQEGTESRRCLGSVSRSVRNWSDGAWQQRSLRALAPGPRRLPACLLGTVTHACFLGGRVSGGMRGPPGTPLCWAQV